MSNQDPCSTFWSPPSTFSKHSRRPLLIKISPLVEIDVFKCTLSISIHQRAQQLKLRTVCYTLTDLALHVHVQMRNLRFCSHVKEAWWLGAISKIFTWRKRQLQPQMSKWRGRVQLISTSKKLLSPIRQRNAVIEDRDYDILMQIAHWCLCYCTQTIAWSYRAGSTTKQEKMGLCISEEVDFHNHIPVKLVNI